ncbi:TetR/AcrR family transcriptional regulator [Schumannella luteola]|uniref:AcrR family transcriptional regulator n=1 Tax=Schumannella luteola TaxID=472059 RepID=A0A852Y7R1_9MICO|nr:TetR/AcrR family transcriptional regulator [Schumannella luteola]NYG97420.1 AcrR family transcriptional regulator [Schumannella luteola]TPX01664.1 TetR/AcrR family transcriptional regulator [Schumannella luteola]
MDSRQKIVDSAKQMFWRHGYSTTSPRQVMADSGVGQGSFYHHFPAKSDLGREVVDANGRELLDGFRADMAAAGTGATGRDRLAVFLKSTGDALAGCRIGGFAYDAGVIAEPTLHAALGSAFANVAELIEQTVREGQADGSLRADLDPAATAAALMSVVEGAFVLARASGSQSTADTAVAGALALLAPPAAG